jgi:omega-hydroxy-beta-dihydromenaquinone-9 sulfotransferase
MAKSPKAEPAEQSSGSKDRLWTPRFWSGINLSGWLGLVWRNRCAITPTRWPMALILTSCCVMNSMLRAVQWLFFGRKIKQARIEQEPIFILGHWRSGTTLLHELLALDPRHTYPDTYAAYCPNHFLVSGWLFRPLLKFLLPERRPMDNMAAGWDRPQEDEFALCNMGVRSPYLTITFPNRPPQDQKYLTLDGLPPQAVARWQRALLWFLKCLTVRSPKRIVLKSPAHTCRIRALLEMFPNARFIHIVRDPYVIFPSTINLWKRLYRDQGLQHPCYEGLEEHVYETFRRMYHAFERDRHLIDPARFCEVRYEDLVKQPAEEVRKMYEHLGLGDFAVVQPAVAAYFAEKADYKTNRYRQPPEQRAEISRRWRSFIEQYDYASEPAEV